MSKHDFFKKMNDDFLALTYDDVQLRTGRSVVMPTKVCVESRFSRNVPLKIPIASAAMDTVTEYEMAIEIALLGGIGIIHRNLSPKEQSAQVAKVKFHMNGFIEKPIFVSENQTIESIVAKSEEKGRHFHSFPVVDKSEKVVGVLTSTNFQFCRDRTLIAKKVMTQDPITAKAGTSLEAAYELMEENKIKVLPIVDNDGKLAGLYVFSDVMRIISGSSNVNNLDKRGQLRVGAAIGVGKDAFERLELLANERIDVVVIDTAHADSKPVFDTLAEIKKQYSGLDIVVGNISEPSSAQRLIEAGADGIKIGQGPGASCTTRVVAGTGCPQLTAIYNCAQIAQGHGVPVCADGGIRFPGYIPKAIGAGAHSVMMGNRLAGTKEAPGQVVLYKNRQWKKYRGMGSLGAMQAHRGSRERYFQGDTGKNHLIPEGIEGLVPYKGELEGVIKQFVGGLRSGMGGVGAANIEELREKAQFWRVSPAGAEESHPHDMEVTEEAPNYQVDEI